MAGIESAVRALIVADTATNDLVSGRVYPYLRQQGAIFPAIVYELDTTEPEQGMGGYLSLTRATLTVNCIASTYSGAKILASNVRSALNGYTGTSDTIVISSLVHDNDTGSIEDSVIGNDRGVSVINSEYVIWYES